MLNTISKRFAFFLKKKKQTLFAVEDLRKFPQSKYEY